MKIVDILSERRDYTLMHGTTVEYLIEIMRSNTLRGTDPDDMGSGVSLTVDENTAEMFSRGHSGDEFGCIFYFSAAKLRQNGIGLKRIRYGGSGEEKEMRTLGDIKNPLGLMDRLVVHRKGIDECLSMDASVDYEFRFLLDHPKVELI